MLKALFRGEGIEVTFREDNDVRIRVSVALFNNRADVSRLLGLLETFA